MSLWVVIVVMALGTLLLKAVGPLVAGGRQPPAPLLGVIGLLTPVLLAALVVASTLTDGRSIVLDARVVGLLIGGGLLLARVPLLIAMVAAAGTVAVLRALT